MSTPTAFLVHTVLKKLSLTKKLESIAIASLALSNGVLGNYSSPKFAAETLMLARDPIVGVLGHQTLIAIFCKLRVELESRAELSTAAQEQVLYMLGCLMKAYMGGMQPETRIAFLQPFFTMIFSSMQNHNLSPQTRNKVLEIMYGVF